jgi:hypothetical protein
VSVLDLVNVDLSTVLWSFHDPTGAVNPNGVRTKLGVGFDMGTAAADVAVGETEDTHVQARQYAPVNVFVPFMASATTAANLRAGLETLNTYLNRGSGVLRWTEGSVVRYADVLDVLNLGALIRGQDLGGLVNPRASSLGPIPLQLLRRPFLFTALVTESAAVIKNDPASGTNPKFRTVTATGNMRTRAIVTIAPESGANIVEALVARRSYGDAAAFRTGWYKQAEAGTLTSAASVVDAAASGGNGVDLFTANRTVFTKRIEWHFTGTTAYEGTFRLRARVKVPADNTVRVQARWAAGNTASLIGNEVVTLRQPTGVASQFAMVELGTVVVSPGQGTTYGLTVELWAAQDAGTSVVTADYLSLWPCGPTPDGRADQSMIVSAPGWRDGTGQSITRYRGNALITPTWKTPAYTGGDAKQGSLYLNNENDTDGAGPPPTTGTVYPAGQVRVRVKCRLLATTQDHTLGELIVRSTNGTGSLVTGATLGNKVEIGAHSLQATKWFTLTFSANGTNAYQPVVVGDHIQNGESAIIIQEMTIETIPTVGNGQELNSSGEYGHVKGHPSAYLTAAGTRAGGLSQSGAFIDLYPGVNDLFYDWGEAPTAGSVNTGLEHADDRGPLANNIIDRNATVTVSYYPRWSA